MARIAHSQQDPAPRGGFREKSKRLNFVSFLAFFGILTIASLVGPTANKLLMATELDATWHAIDDIAETAERFVLDQFGTTGANMKPEAGYLDARLQLANCSEDLEGFLQNGSTLNSRLAVGVQCTGEKPWKIYVPVRVIVTDTVVATRRALPSGHSLTMDDMVVAERDVSRQTGGYVARPDEILGKRLKQRLPAGRVITPAMLRDEIVIKRGQSVTITAQNGGLSIATAGTALMDGTLNERIRVENSDSGRVLEAIVRSPERVEVLVY
ncbi:MAG: flagellar basal body P-ring formation chaperone FlgA [Gammaproteobacteria bacterium]|nr:flagellar basal body P-ring formation chaperone FlgA [Gammaproteobacteria bacterium]